MCVLWCDQKGYPSHCSLLKLHAVHNVLNGYWENVHNLNLKKNKYKMLITSVIVWFFQPRILSIQMCLVAVYVLPLILAMQR